MHTLFHRVHTLFNREDKQTPSSFFFLFILSHALAFCESSTNDCFLCIWHKLPSCALYKRQSFRVISNFKLFSCTSDYFQALFASEKVACKLFLLLNCLKCDTFHSICLHLNQMHTFLLTLKGGYWAFVVSSLTENRQHFGIAAGLRLSTQSLITTVITNFGKQSIQVFFTCVTTTCFHFF